MSFLCAHSVSGQGLLQLLEREWLESTCLNQKLQATKEPASPRLENRMAEALSTLSKNMSTACLQATCGYLKFTVLFPKTDFSLPSPPQKKKGRKKLGSQFILQNEPT